MEAARGRNTADLNRHLIEEGRRFDFFQAVRLLQRNASDDPGMDPVGTGDNPAREVVRFSSQVSFGFPSSDIVDIEAGAREGDPTELEVSFMGVAGPASYGSLPLPYAEHILSLGRDRKKGLRDFLDIFNHRMISLFYRAWEKYRFALICERSGGRPGILERAIYATMGMGLSSQRGRLSFNDRALLARAGSVRGRAASANSLGELIRSYFKVKVDVQQFVPCWYTIEESERCRLGQTSCRLGEDTSLGSRVRLAQSRFRIKLGPLDWHRFHDFLPTGDGFRPLVELVSLSAGPEFDFDCQLVLSAESAPGLRLAVCSDDADGKEDYEAPRLGWSTWLHNDPLPMDPDDIVIDGECARHC